MKRYDVSLVGSGGWWLTPAASPSLAARNFAVKHGLVHGRKLRVRSLASRRIYVYKVGRRPAIIHPLGSQPLAGKEMNER